VLSTTTAPASTSFGAHSALTAAAGRGEHEVEALDRLSLSGRTRSLAVPLDLLAGRALGGERDDLGGGEVALGQQLEDGRADQPGRAQTRLCIRRRHREYDGLSRDRRAVPAPVGSSGDRVGAELESRVQGAHRLRHLVGGDHA
jgi:hypothetical protein